MSRKIERLNLVLLNNKYITNISNNVYSYKTINETKETSGTLY